MLLAGGWWRLQNSKIAIDATTDLLADKRCRHILPVKQNLDKENGSDYRYVGRGNEKPESPKVSCPTGIRMYRIAAAEYSGKNPWIWLWWIWEVFASAPAGNIRVRDIFSWCLSKTNWWYSGWKDRSEQIVRYFAKEGGQGVWGIRMEIKDEKPENILIGGQPVNPEKLYSIATNDYLPVATTVWCRLPPGEKSGYRSENKKYTDGIRDPRKS